MNRLYLAVAVLIAVVSAVNAAKVFPIDWKLPATNPRVLSQLSHKQASWQYGENEFFANKTLAEAKRLLGFKRNPATRAKMPVVKNVMSGLPDNYDASAAYPKCNTIGTIYNQAECGSCWAFGCVESASDRLCIQSNGTINLLLSFLDEVACGPDDGCEGGDAGDAWNYVVDSGLVTDSCYPYNIPTCPPQQQPCMNFVDTPTCTQSCVDSENWTKSKHFFARAYGVDSDEASIRTEIFSNGPVEACFTVYEDFLSYKSGVYSYQTGDELGGHCVKCIGWGVENGTPYWLCNNSWTTYWGDNGQFKIARGQDMCGIEDDVVAGSLN